MNGVKQPGDRLRMPEGQAIAGAAIGILVLDLWYPLLQGNVANASSYDYPVIYKVMKGTSIPMIHSADQALLDHIIEGGRELIQQGARAIQNRLKMPVFDFITLINWIHHAVVRQPFRGFI